MPCINQLDGRDPARGYHAGMPLISMFEANEFHNAIK